MKWDSDSCRWDQTVTTCVLFHFAIWASATKQLARHVAVIDVGILVFARACSYLCFYS